jgi:hypothetical protein
MEELLLTNVTLRQQYTSTPVRGGPVLQRCDCSHDLRIGTWAHVHTDKDINS